ncbi:MAG: hypothetical protein H8D87_19000 [Deltaproteobacteria bacterium]|uniref:hypothetical protein n=1 Tax=Desulfobacula sp. TaxID=2593537 RepID=UPI0019958AEA|nr:hypothetical protein [Candidatus Desulfobacula maris]MBL6995580.1 hypothetical protein [Desulfobacula sp.]
MKKTFLLLNFILAAAILASFPINAPAPPTAIQMGTNDFYSHMDDTYGVKALPRVETGTVANPALLNSHGFKAKKGDAVQIHDLGNGKLKLLHPKSGKSIIVKLPPKK